VCAALQDLNASDPRFFGTLACIRHKMLLYIDKASLPVIKTMAHATLFHCPPSLARCKTKHLNTSSHEERFILDNKEKLSSNFASMVLDYISNDPSPAPELQKSRHPAPSIFLSKQKSSSPVKCTKQDPTLISSRPVIAYSIHFNPEK
jgi:hypothetical protein